MATHSEDFFIEYHEGEQPFAELQDAVLHAGIGITRDDGIKLESEDGEPITLECYSPKEAVKIIRECFLHLASQCEAGAEIILEDDEDTDEKFATITNCRLYSPAFGDELEVKLELLFDYEDLLAEADYTHEDVGWKWVFVEMLENLGYDPFEPAPEWYRFGAGMLPLFDHDEHRKAVHVMWLEEEEIEYVEKLREMGEAAREAYESGVPLLDLTA